MRVVFHARVLAVTTDRLDARTLAQAAGGRARWTRSGCPTSTTRAMRRRLARRAQLVRPRTRAKNEIHAVLMRRLKGRPPVTDLFGVKGRAWLAELRAAASRSARPSTAACARSTSSTPRSRVVERLIAADALELPEARRLMTVPGVNVIVAATFLAASATSAASRPPQAGRLPRPGPAGSASPGDGPATHGHISKQGSAAARHALVEAALERRPPARPAARLLPAHPRPPRHSDRDRRHRAQARRAVLVPAHPRARTTPSPSPR